MKNTLWHFGDSFGCWCDEHETKKGYSNYISEYFNLNHQHRAKESLSNSQIISRIIKEIPNIKNGDFILINWSFFDRFPVIKHPLKDGEVSSLNSLIQYEVDELGNVLDSYKVSKEYFDYNIFQRSNFQLEEWSVLFWLFLKPTMETLCKLNCKIYVSFNNQLLGDVKYNINNDLLHGMLTQTPTVMTQITDNYIGVLNDNNWYSDDDGCVHYKANIQEEVGRWWIKKIENKNLKNE